MKRPTRILGTLLLFLLGMATYAMAQEGEPYIAKVRGDGHYGFDEYRGVYQLHCGENGRCWRRYRDVRRYPRFYAYRAHDHEYSQREHRRDHEYSERERHHEYEERHEGREEHREERREERREGREERREGREGRSEGRRCNWPVRAVGQGAVTVAGAQRAAEKVWMETVIFDFGQAYADPEMAHDIDWLCSRASLRSVLGATLHKCALRAIPCRPEVSHEGRGMVKEDEEEDKRGTTR